MWEVGTQMDQMGQHDLTSLGPLQLDQLTSHWPPLATHKSQTPALQLGHQCFSSFCLLQT